jgi:hypoxanthine phosphoribosyltransferase
LSKGLKVLIGKEEIERRVKELAGEIESSFPPPFTVISLLKGAFVFTSDLVRNLEGVEVDFMRLKSYRGKRRGETAITLEPELPVAGRKILLVDDIFDTGESLEFAVRWLRERGAGEVRTCVLLDKDVEKRTSLRPDFVGFKVPDYFVVGYGLDLDEKFRELPYVAYLKE